MNKIAKIVENTIANGRVVLKGEIINVSDLDLINLVKGQKAIEISQEEKERLINIRTEITELKQEDKKLTKRGK